MMRRGGIEEVLVMDRRGEGGASLEVRAEIVRLL